MEYDYELTVQSGYELINVTDTIIPDLETSFSTVILETLFGMDCGPEESSNVEGVDGLSTLGVDIIDGAESCTLSTTTDNSTTCYVVNGELTIYMNYSSSMDYSTVVLGLLEAGMDNNDFVTVDGIDSVVFIDSSTNTTSDSEQSWREWFDEKLKPFFDEVRENTTLYWVVIFSPFICLCGIFLCCGFGCNRDGGEKSDDKKRGSTDDDTESAAERGLGADSDDGSDEEDDDSDNDGSDDDGSDDDESGDDSDYSDYESD